mmetsp:Transcript_37288/g.117449  ORF Transcript_37288/g.117449 Transcript_37288/m.117449 type:complete len:228 (-) Transcript_37288:911-1594(-)
MPKDEAKKRCWLVDSKGLVVHSRLHELQHHKIPYAHEYPEEIKEFIEVVRKLKPTAIIGVSAQAGAFSQQVIELMAELNERPIIFPLSNPTSKAECTAEEAVKFTKGKVLFASGSPFPAMEYEGKRFVPGQGNNAYIFPGVGLGAVLGGLKHVTDGMLRIAAQAVADTVTPEDVAVECLYPPLTKIRSVSAKIALMVIEEAKKENLATRLEIQSEDQVRKEMYDPAY